MLHHWKWNKGSCKGPYQVFLWLPWGFKAREFLLSLTQGPWSPWYRKGILKRNILSLLKGISGELSEAHSLIKLSAANNSATLVLKNFEADIELLGFPVPWVGFLIVKDPNTLLEPQHYTQLLGVIDCNLIWLGCVEFGRIYGFEPFKKFQCPNGIQPIVFTKFRSYFHQQKLWAQTKATLSTSPSTSSDQVNISTLRISSEAEKTTLIVGQMQFWVKCGLVIHTNLSVFLLIQLKLLVVRLTVSLSD